MTNPKESVHPDTKENPQFNHQHFGLTKREYFAAMAMQGYCGGEFTGQSGKPHEDMAEWSVEMADALIEALNKTEK